MSTASTSSSDKDMVEDYSQEQGQGQEHQEGEVHDEVLHKLKEDIKLANALNGRGDLQYIQEEDRFFLDRLCCSFSISSSKHCQYGPILPHYDGMAHWFTQWLLIDGIYDSIPKPSTSTSATAAAAASYSSLKDYFESLNELLKCTSLNVFLAEPQYQIAFRLAELFMLPTLRTILRLIKLMEQEMVRREESREAFTIGFNSLHWIPPEVWMHASKGVVSFEDDNEGRPPLKFKGTRKDEESGNNIDVAVCEYELIFFCREHLYQTSWNEEDLSKEESTVIGYKPARPLTGYPNIHDPRFPPFLSCLHPLFVTLVGTYGLDKYRLQHPKTRYNVAEMERVDKILRLCRYYLRLVESDYASQFRDIDLHRPDADIPFEAPRFKRKQYHNTHQRSLYLDPNRQDQDPNTSSDSKDHRSFGGLLFSYPASFEVEKLMKRVMKEAMPSELWNHMYESSFADRVKKGREVFEALFRLGEKQRRKIQKYWRQEGKSGSAARYWIRRNLAFEKDMERIETLRLRLDNIKSILLDRKLGHLIHDIDPQDSPRFARIRPSDKDFLWRMDSES